MEETRYQRLAREQAERQAKRAKLLKRGHFTNGAWRIEERSKAAKAGIKRRSEESYEDRLDDLGESPDY